MTTLKKLLGVVLCLPAASVFIWYMFILGKAFPVTLKQFFATFGLVALGLIMFVALVAGVIL